MRSNSIIEWLRPDSAEPTRNKTMAAWKKNLRP